MDIIPAMNEQYSPTADLHTEKAPLEKQGHLSRAHLYILLVLLSAAILLLCGYIVWDKLQNTEGTHGDAIRNDESTISDSETDSSTEEPDNMSAPDTVPDDSEGNSTDGGGSDENHYTWSAAGYTFSYPDGWTVSPSPQYGSGYPDSTTVAVVSNTDRYSITLDCEPDTIGCIDGQSTLTDAIRITAIPNDNTLEHWVENSMLDGLTPSSDPYSPQTSPQGTTYHKNIRPNCWDACGYDPIELHEYFFVPEGETGYVFGILVYGLHAGELETTVLSIMDSMGR